MDNLESEIERRMKICEAATPGPWSGKLHNPRRVGAYGKVKAHVEFTSRAGSDHQIVFGCYQPTACMIPIGAEDKAVAEFILHARTGYPAALEALRVAVKGTRQAASDIRWTLQKRVDGNLCAQDIQEFAKSAERLEELLAAIKHALGAAG